MLTPAERELKALRWRQHVYEIEALAARLESAGDADAAAQIRGFIHAADMSIEQLGAHLVLATA